MEYSFSDVERKFSSSLIEVQYTYSKNLPLKTEYVYIENVGTHDDHVTMSFQLDGDYITAFTPTMSTPTKKYPLVIPVYRYFPSGFYWDKQNRIVFVKRRPVKTFSVGINAHSHECRLYISTLNVVGSTINPHFLDLKKPRLFNSPLLSKQLLRDEDRIKYLGDTVGMVSEDNVLYSTEELAQYMQWTQNP